MKMLRHPLILLLAVLPAVSSRAQDSPHGQLEVPCEQCHSADSWSPTRSPLKFDHGSTSFPLRGQHAVVPCRQCHSTLKFAGAPERCADCHQDLHRGELGAACERCHTSSTWLVPDMVRRHAQTRFTLLGAHATAPCQSCHTNQQKHQFAGVPTDCYGCHASDYQGARSPDHRAAGFSTDCSQCHKLTDVRWGGGFDHAKTSFPLVGAHRAVACAECHKTPVFTGLPTTCYACHQQVFLSAANPRHSPGFSTECVTCHTPTAWRPAVFDHARTSFPLAGAHAAVPCASCHRNGVYAGTSTSCADAGCHLTAYNATTNPAHLAGGFSTTCATCHSTTAWRPATFNHATARFALTGAHVATPCNSCHKGGIYTGTPMTCGDAGCHLPAYNATTNPAHLAGGFSTACATCHSTTAWRPATFNHATTRFPLTGAHTSAACVACHKNGIYTGTPTTCADAGCHLPDYNATTNPAHAAAGFPLACESCHNTSAWAPSTFNHTPFFPISAGSRHSPGRWTTCADCHRVATDFKQFSCIDCHEHSPKSKVDAQHQGRSGYAYTSPDCYRCHPQGRSE